MTKYPGRTQRIILCNSALTLLVLAVIAGCGQREAGPAPQEIEFRVDPTLVGPVYENRSLGLAFQPPINWQILDDAQRQAVLEALSSSQDDGDYTLDVMDVFFDTESLSFLSVSQVTGTGRGTATPSVAEYSSSMTETLGIVEDAEPRAGEAIASKVTFAIDDLPVTQFRHVRANRITFTLVLTTSTGSLAQLDYSIPAENYQRESVKLESSIGTIALTSPDQN